MANITATQTVQELISYSIVKDKDSLVRLLERNGVQMPNNSSNREVTTAVLLANEKSPTFKKDLANLLGNNFTKAQEDFKSFAADPADFGFTGTLSDSSPMPASMAFRSIVQKSLKHVNVSIPTGLLKSISRRVNSLLRSV